MWPMMIVNSNHECIAFDKVIHMSVVSEGISRNFSAIILAKMVNGDDKVISRYLAIMLLLMILTEL